MHITSVDNDKIKYLSKLKMKKYRDEYKEFLIEDIDMIKIAYEKKLLVGIYTNTVDLGFDVETYYVNDKIINKLTDLKSPTNIIGVCKYLDNNKIGNKVLMLDNISNPGNLGTIIRSSVAFNIDTIIMSNDTVDLYNDKVLRSTKGMIFDINIIKCELIPMVNTLKTKGYKIYSTKVDGGTSIYNYEFNDKLCVILGNEGNGVKNEITNICDDYIYIPMNTDCESLNVSIAASIIIYEINKLAK